MDNTKRKGAVSVTITYICWGLLTVFWNLLAEVNSAYVLAQRVVWSMLLCLDIWLSPDGGEISDRYLQTKRP